MHIDDGSISIISLRSKVHRRNAYDDWDVQTKVPHVPKAVGKPYKFAPKEYTTESSIEVFGDHIVTYTGLHLGRLDDDLTVFDMVSPQLAEDYRTWWKLIWDLLPDPSGEDRHGRRGPLNPFKR